MSFLTLIVFLALLGSGLIAGTFFAFSNFVMKALANVPSPEGIWARQSINVVVLNPVFLGTFMGTAALSVLIAVQAILGWGAPSSPWFLIGAVLYVVGTFMVTGMGNVPLNNQLAAVGASDAAAVTVWEHYLDRWTFLNTVRTVAATIAVLMFTIGLVKGAGA